MAEIITSIDPGQYMGAQTLTVTFPANTRKVIITRDDRSPVLTEILAYDRGYLLPIPSNPNPAIGEGPIVDRPFLAVTQDGRGNVIYDGGFPKFYNSHIASANGGQWPATLPTTLAGLAPACRYLLNALSFIANPRKVAQGNRKILFLNNTVRTLQYNILKSYYHPDPLQNNAGGDGFRDTFDAVCNIGGWIPTYIDCTSNGNTQLTVSLATMEQYAAVVYLASNGGSGPSTSTIAESTASAISQYRNAGSGVAIITDHCSDNYTNLADAIARGGVFGHDATKVAKYFGAYFSGDVARSPVQVGEIRRQIGDPGPPEDHPLLAGMADTDYIFAGGSESLIVPELYPNDQVSPDQPWTLSMPTAGTYRANILVQLDDGTILTRPLKYIIINPSDVNLRDSFNNIVGNAYNTYMGSVEYNVDGTSATQVLLGKIEVDGVLGAFFRATPNGLGGWSTVYYPFGGVGSAVPIKNGQTMKFTVTDPFEYSISRVVTIPDPAPYLAESGSIPMFAKKIVTHPYFSGKTAAAAISDITNFVDKYYAKAKTLGSAIQSHWWRTMGKARIPFLASELNPANLRVYANAAAWTVGKPSFGNVGDAVVVADTNTVYYWDDIPMVWKLHTAKANVILTQGRKVINTLDGSLWVVNASNTTKV
ncbi:virion structural protein [Pseudomonas phage D6]|nr:virion structural protein [Pseudomonas phage D6]